MTSDKQAAHWLETLNRLECEQAGKAFIDVPAVFGEPPDDEDDIDLGEELDDLVLELDVDEELKYLVRKQKGLKARVKQLERREIPKVKQDFDQFRAELAKLMTARVLSDNERAKIRDDLGKLNLQLHAKLNAISTEQRQAKRRRIDLAKRQRAFVQLTRHLTGQVNEAKRERIEIRAEAEALTNRVDGHDRDVASLKSRTGEHHADIKRLFEHGVERSTRIKDLDQRLMDLAGTVRAEAEVRADETEMIAEFVRQLSEREIAEIRQMIRSQANEHNALVGRVGQIEHGLMRAYENAPAPSVIESMDPDSDDVIEYDETEITEIMPTREPRRIGRTVAKAAVAAAVLAFALLVPIMDFGSRNPPAHADEQTAQSKTTNQESTTCQKHRLLEQHILLFECPDGVDRRCKLSSQDATGTYTDCTVYKIE